MVESVEYQIQHMKYNHSQFYMILRYQLLTRISNQLMFNHVIIGLDLRGY